ncbi:MAG TPA: hypothetical protein VFB45_24765 [Pseudolabrys sp.]|nr:hypothetical protein [Pseudolabrys sp.]
MRCKFAALAVALTAGTFSTLGHTQELAQFGQQTCRQWLETHQTSNAQANAADAWVLGHIDALAKFIDANNEMKGLPPTQALKGLDGSTVLALMEGSCRGNPRRTVADALDGLSAQLLASNSRVVQNAAR